MRNSTKFFVELHLQIPRNLASQKSVPIHLYFNYKLQIFSVKTLNTAFAPRQPPSFFCIHIRHCKW